MKRIIKMGVKSALKIENVSNGKIKVNGLILPSLTVFRKIENVSKKLEKLYSEELINGSMITINYSSIRDDEEEFINILDEVKNLIDDFLLRLILIETEDAAFNKLFPGIINFLYEGQEYENEIEDRYTKKTPDYIKGGITKLANSLWELGINPGEF